MATLREQIAEALRISGKTGYRLALDARVGVAQVNRFLRGERGLRLESLERLMEVLGLELVLRPPIALGALVAARHAPLAGAEAWLPPGCQKGYRPRRRTPLWMMGEP